MERFDKKEKGTDSNLKIAVASGTIAALTLVENMLDINLPLSPKAKWIIFAVFTVIAAVFFSRILRCPSGPKTRSSPMVRPISPNLKKYIEATEDRPKRNQVRIHVGRFRLSLNTSQMCDVSGAPMIDQAVHWELEGSNISHTPMTSFTIAISLSAYTSWKDNAISFQACLKKKNGAKKHQISAVEWKEQSDQNREDIRFLTFKFPQGIQCIYAEPFIFELDMIWNRGAHFHDVEQYFSDPSNYGVQVDKLLIEVVSDSQDILDRHFLLYRTSREGQGLTLLEPPRTTQRAPVSWTVKPKNRVLYVIEIKK